mmetsp:Transcript_22040/g.36476  ORF Transcript_22040/g.36476 Transcript_22040/m.36476 type:complete len:243 (-) Transcript_22040:140-868(-)|eukprot:CAMPEP_0119004324 /NCGR_PEP_ID=MMETSP1176-20130426/1079_1 /TAXON_ID=265551 /ORGANISM="Synedropsis recta cf, Strain CCMP1620" /LENGTH=242 /DNA_ID=CAMNT_0006956015 /DNA_START=35 /DNA_END=763 /DNA_ORIENTATION=+
MPNSAVMTSSALVGTGWFLWFLSAAAICLQIMWNNAPGLQVATTALRYLEEGADEDDRYAVQEDAGDDEDLEWFQLERWIDPQSLSYDIIEGFLYAADAFFIAWILWGCLVHCGVLPDERLNRNRRHRRIKDGRGVFSPMRNFDPFESDADDDDDNSDASRDSMEYGNSHQDELLDDEIDIKQEEKKLSKAAERFFKKAETHKKQKNEAKNAPGPGEEGVMLLDLEMADQPVRTHDADVVFL